MQLFTTNATVSRLHLPEKQRPTVKVSVACHRSHFKLQVLLPWRNILQQSPLAQPPSSDFELTQLEGTVEKDSLSDSQRTDAGTDSKPSLPLLRREETVGQPDDEVTPIESAMSRTPLLLPSSPAHGTDSYGILPVHSTTSDEVEEEETMALIGDAIEEGRKIPKRKGKSALQRTSSAYVEGSPCDSEARAGSGAALRRGNSLPTRRRPWASGDGLRNATGVGQETNLESRFTASGIPTYPSGPNTLFEGFHSSSDSGNDGISESGDTTDSNSSKHHHPVDIPEEVLDNSPFAAVRASVAATDDTSLSINTPRMWVLSMLFAIFGSATNLFFSLRYPSVSITPVIALLIVHPIGLLWDRTLKRFDDPDETFENGSLRTRSPHICANDHDDEPIPVRSSPASSNTTLSVQISWRRRLRLWLAQGRWNEKEHCCVFISSNVSFGFAFATDVSRL